MLVAVSAATVPQAPYWPSKFAQDFQENIKMNRSNVEILGTYQYEAVTGSSRLSRTNGRYDPSCNGYLNFDQVDAPCQHLIVNNTRFMFYPNTQDCCYCCSAYDGCGIIRQDQIQEAGFIEITNFVGPEAYQWVFFEGPGQDHPSYLWETTEANPLDRQILKFERNNQSQMYSQDKYRKNLQPIQLPGSCSLSNKCPRGECAEFRQNSLGDIKN